MRIKKALGTLDQGFQVDYSDELSNYSLAKDVLKVADFEDKNIS